MSETQAADPNKDNQQTVVEPGKDSSVLTGDQTAAPADTALSADGAGQQGPPKWMAQLPADLKSDESLTKFPTIADLGKSYKELEGKLGKAVILPAVDAPAEEWAKFYARVGRPEKSSDYKLDKVELPAGLTVDEATKAKFLEKAHAEGLTNKQANTLYQWYMADIGQQVVAAQKLVKTTKEEAENSLRKEWGANYDAEMAHAQKGFAMIANPAITALFVKSGIGNLPEVLKGFAKIGKAISEDAFVDGSRTRGAEAEVKDPAHILYPNNP